MICDYITDEGVAVSINLNHLVWVVWEEERGSDKILSATCELISGKRFKLIGEEIENLKVDIKDYNDEEDDLPPNGEGNGHAN